MDGALMGTTNPCSKLQFLLHMWLNFLRGVRPFFMKIAENPITPFKHMFEPG